jgi:hypothetical protein
VLAPDASVTMFTTDRSHTDLKQTVREGSVVEAGIIECRSQVCSTFATLLGCYWSGCHLSSWLFDTDFVGFFDTSSQNSDE